MRGRSFCFCIVDINNLSQETLTHPLIIRQEMFGYDEHQAKCIFGVFRCFSCHVLLHVTNFTGGKENPVNQEV